MWASDTTDANEPNETSEIDSVEHRRIPPEVAENLRLLYGTDDGPATFGEWIEAIATVFGDDWPPAIDDLCHDDEGRHRAVVGTGDGTETYRFVCVLDAILLPFLVESSVGDSAGKSVEVASECPETGERVTTRASRDRIEVDPDDAVLSFGVAETDEHAEPTAELTYGAMCPYIHAFADRDAYDRWAAETDAPTTALPLDEGLALARAIVRA